MQKYFYNWCRNFYQLKNCKWYEKAIDRVLVKKMTVEPRTDSDLDAEDDDVPGVTDTLTPEQRDFWSGNAVVSGAHTVLA